MERTGKRLDLHMHTTVSDGTDTPEEILMRVRGQGLNIFSVTDHDSIQLPAGFDSVEALIEDLASETVKYYLSKRSS